MGFIKIKIDQKEQMTVNPEECLFSAPSPKQGDSPVKHECSESDTIFSFLDEQAVDKKFPVKKTISGHKRSSLFLPDLQDPNVRNGQNITLKPRKMRLVQRDRQKRIDSNFFL